MLPVVGTVSLLPPKRREPGLANQSLVLAPSFGFHTSRVASLDRYILLSPRAVDWTFRTVQVSLTVAPDGGARLSWGAISYHLDRLGNPAPGPNAGSDLSVARLQLLQEVFALRQAVNSVVPERIRWLAERTRGRFPELLREPPYAAVLGVVHARALASAGEPAEAVAVLEETAEAAPFEDVVIALAHLEAVAGRRSEAIRRLLPFTESGRSPRAWHDMSQLLLRLAAEEHDPAAARRWTEMLVMQETTPDRQAALAAALDARVRLWWGQPTAADCEVRSQTYAPEGDAVAGLARWRLGRGRPDDVERMQAAIADWPDAEREGRTALAAAQLAGGSAEEAKTTLDRLVDDLEVPAREDFAAHQLLHLARALRAQALLAAGRGPEARSEAETLLASPIPGLLPSNLTHEVLEGTGSR